MDWLSITLAMAGGATLTVGVICLLSYVLDRSLRGRLMFSVAAMSVWALAFCELRLVGTTDAESYAWWMHWAHVPLFAALVSIAWFVRLWMCTGRMWLLWAVTLLRGLILVLNFVYVPNFNYAELTSVERVMLPGGVEASVPEGVISRRSRLGELSVLLLIVFVVDATVSAWRGRVGVERYGALLTGGGVTAFVLLGVVMTALTHRDWVSMQYLISLGFLLPVMAMGMQLSGTVVRAAMLSKRLDENVKALESSGRQSGLALAAGQMGVWEWAMVADRIVLNEQGCQLLGVSGRTSLGLEEFLALVDPEDRERVRGAIRTSVGGDGEYAVEYRVGG